ncbi:MAG: histidine kinase, partial [Gorillibacterium sp.]|nr:histidine kinase [Gorillibacterium sp.]
DTPFGWKIVGVAYASELIANQTQFKLSYLFWCVLGVAVALLLSFTLSRRLSKPIKQLQASMKQLEKGNLDIRSHIHSTDEIGQLGRTFNIMVGKIKELMEQIIAGEELKRKSEMKLLQAQINPHFLYNSFFILKGLVRRGEEELSLRMLDSLGEYFKFITRSGSEEVTLEAELGHALSYLEIQNMRFAGAIDATCDPLPEAWKDILVPRLILQPLVENAYKHGLEDKVAGGRLDIHFTPYSTELSVIVEDNGEQLDDDRLLFLEQELQRSHLALEMTGILNVCRRLRLYYGEAYGLQASRSALGGLQIQFMIPLRKEES